MREIQNSRIIVLNINLLFFTVNYQIVHAEFESDVRKTQEKYGTKLRQTAYRILEDRGAAFCLFIGPFSDGLSLTKSGNRVTLYITKNSEKTRSLTCIRLVLSR